MLKQERVAAKPNSDSIQRSKKLWEKLRIKSAVDKEERKKLVAELFQIITGKVKDFVFKHDSVRVIQCALKYATPDQRKQIAQELKGSYRELAESKYAKFLIAKMITLDGELKDLIVPEFYGHVKRLIRHPDASWIMDDIYRAVASPQQKAVLLREWYGGEFVLLNKQRDVGTVAADLSDILTASPEKRSPIMQHLKEMTNQLVQKKTTGFTMLHDALLQYFLNCAPGSSEHSEFLEMLKDDEEGDLFKNLAFTKSGSKIVCLALAYGNSKDRRTILKHFKTHMKLLAYDRYGHLVLLSAYEAIDDTVMTAKAIFPELTNKDMDQETRDIETLNLALDLTGRISLLYLMSANQHKSLLVEEDIAMLEKMHEIRKTTSKKDPETRRTELNKALSQPLLDFVASQAAELVKTSHGCYFVTEVLLGAIGDKDAALSAVATLADGSTKAAVLTTPHAGRMFKSLTQGGRFDPKTKTVVLCDPPLAFHQRLYDILTQSSKLLDWTRSDNSWTILAMLESADFGKKQQLITFLKEHVNQLVDPESDSKAASSGVTKIIEVVNGETGDTSVKRKKKDKQKGEKN